MTEQPPSYDPTSQPPQPPAAPPPPPPAYGQAPPAYGQAPPAYGQPQYGQPAPAYGYPQPTDTSGKATAALVLGIASVILCGLFTGIPAIVLGFSAKKDIAATQGRLGGNGLATAGIVLGSIGIVLSIAIGVLLGVAVSNLNCTSTSTGTSSSFNCN